MWYQNLDPYSGLANLPTTVNDDEQKALEDKSAANLRAKIVSNAKKQVAKEAIFHFELGSTEGEVYESPTAEVINTNNGKFIEPKVPVPDFVKNKLKLSNIKTVNLNII